MFEVWSSILLDAEPNFVVGQPPENLEKPRGQRGSTLKADAAEQDHERGLSDGNEWL